MTVGSTPCRYIELAILITLIVALILVHCMRACVAKGATTARDICLVHPEERQLASVTAPGAIWAISDCLRECNLRRFSVRERLGSWALKLCVYFSDLRTNKATQS